MRKLILIVSICLSMEFTLSVYGCGPDTAVNQVNIESGGPERKNPSEMSAAEIVETLYLNVPDQTIAAAAKDEVMILTGEAPATELHGYIKIGEYKGSQVYEHCEIWALLGETDFSAIKTEDGYMMLMPYGELPDGERMIRNKQSMDRLYNVVWDIREATAGMGQKETSDYIIHYLRSHLKAYDQDASDHIATWLQAGFADCGIYSGLYYLIGSSCGLNLEVVNGTVQGISHAWNQIQIDGEWKHVDLAYGRSYYSDLEAERLGYKIQQSR